MGNPYQDTNRYDHRTVEKKWQKVWLEHKINTPDILHAKKPYYNLMMFPYPSAEGLHVGNMYAFTGSDIHGRFMRMMGYDVFEPIGLDGFGIHSENYALKVKRHPKEHVKQTEKRFYEQLRKIGAMFDWSRTLETYDPSYYRFTQWLFTEMFTHGLAYRKKASVNVCPSCKTVLADEQVLEKDGAHVCERCGNTVEKKSLEQWFFRITAYAEKLLGNISELQWSDIVKTAQTNWIGKKEGITITYPVFTDEGEKVGEIDCFTTRPDTNFGATFVVIAPEHEFVRNVLDYVKSPGPAGRFFPKTPTKGPLLGGFPTPVTRFASFKEIESYVSSAKQKSETERIAEGKKKTGVATGLYCLNKLNNVKMPLYISDFVLAGFGSGAVVGVPGHDKRDFEFAQTFHIPVIRVVVGKDMDKSDIKDIKQVQEDEGIMMNSGFLDGLDIHVAREKMMDYLEEKKWGKRGSSYHLRDWLISRQRYWGPPIPMIYCENCAKAGRSWFSESGAEAANENLDPSSDASTTSPSASSLRASEAGQSFARSPGPFENLTLKIENSSSLWDADGWFPVPENDLPVLLPDIADYKPGDDGIAPLAKHKEFYEVACPVCGGKARRETDVSDTFLDSSWYFLRYPSVAEATSGKIPWNLEITAKWLPVAMYTGGAEHSVLHLLYSRFVTMALHDFGYLPFDEPFANFFAHGLVIKDGAKMSKSKGNVVNPDVYIEKYGADALRLYLMFMGPLSQGGDFRDTGMEGMARWVGRVWRLLTKSAKCTALELQKGQIDHIHSFLHKTIMRVTDDMKKRRYNTAIALLMEFTNFVGDHGKIMAPEDAKDFIKILAPFSPHIAEELWELYLGKGDDAPDPKKSVHCQKWPKYDKAIVTDTMIPIVIQINGKVRDTISVPVFDAKNTQFLENSAKVAKKTQKYLSAGKLVKTIVVPGKLVNFVVI